MDVGSFLCALVLGYAEILGSGPVKQESADAQEPLLNDGAHGSRDETVSATSGGASLFRNAGFLSTLTFYWMGPLLAVGHRKTLDLEDVPQQDERDSVNGAFPIFKSKLVYCSSSSSSSSGGTITTFKLAKALLLSTW